jgi:hypothetical protein
VITRGRELVARPGAADPEPCIFASVSSTSLVMPLPSIAATPCSRSADSSVGYTRLLGIGRAEMMLTVPLILGSSTKLRPVISDTALTDRRRCPH